MLSCETIAFLVLGACVTKCDKWLEIVTCFLILRSIYAIQLSETWCYRIYLECFLISYHVIGSSISIPWKGSRLAGSQEDMHLKEQFSPYCVIQGARPNIPASVKHKKISIYMLPSCKSCCWVFLFQLFWETPNLCERPKSSKTPEEFFEFPKRHFPALIYI